MHRAPMAFARSGWRRRLAGACALVAALGLGAGGVRAMQAHAASASGQAASVDAAAVARAADGCQRLAAPGAALATALGQTGWLEATGALLAALALPWAVVALSMRARWTRARSHFEDRLRERERIARELHDTLLQGTQGLVLNFQVAAGELPVDDARRRRLETLLDDADDVIAHARDRVFNLRDRELDAIGLATSLPGIGADLAAGTAIRFEARVEGDLSRVRPEVAGEALLLGRAALSNAFRHSRGDRVELEIAATRAGLRVTVHDNGDGITERTLAAGSRPGHWGLVGMKERAVRLGGRLVIASEPGEGTDVRLEVPARRAFVRRCPLRLAILRQWLGDRLMKRLKKEVSE